MKTFNITAQIYSESDKTKQTLLINEIVDSNSEEYAIQQFKELCNKSKTKIVKIYSVELV